MYTGRGFSEWGIGDVDVVFHEGRFHLFHLVLPNHAYIAHAVSDDGLHWTRVRNALFLGEPGEFDDDMLWTMHVSPDPDRPGGWRMFYTGLSRAERGRVQRVGLALSDDLVEWRRSPGGAYPLAASGPHYESGLDEGRHWVSFRDPFFCRVNGERWLLAAGRVSNGPVIRRGCVAALREVERDRFEAMPPLHWPRLYDDVEVPNLFQLGGTWYLLGSIREDIKVHYWQSETPQGPYRNFSDNVLLPQGNYAARVCPVGDRLLVWSFFFENDRRIEGMSNVLPPPKELQRAEDGQLVLRSYSGFDREVGHSLGLDELTPFEQPTQNRQARLEISGGCARLGCTSGVTVFLVRGRYESFRMRGRLTMEGKGKCGLVLRLNDEGDGYLLSLDIFKGLAQLRAWGASGSGDFERAFRCETLQAGFYVSDRTGRFDFELLAFGKYLELSLNGEVLLTLVDDSYSSGSVGFYTESALLRVEHLELQPMSCPREEVCQPLI